jgi:hypothetical protein
MRFCEVVELEVDADLVVLEGDQGKRETRVAAEPELEGHVECVLGRAAEELAWMSWARRRRSSCRSPRRPERSGS